MSEKFLAIPVPLFSLTGDYKDVMQQMCSYCLVKAGHVERERMDEDTVEEKLEETKTPYGFNKNKTHHVETILGASLLNVSTQNVPSSVARYETANTAIQLAESHFGPSPLAFISSTLFWECHNGTGLSWREFTILCAVNSVIGLTRKSPVRITREMILARSVGYKRKQDMDSAKSRKLPRPELITTSQLRTALDHLEEAEFFVRVAPSPRRCYFSKGVSREETRDAVKKLMERKSKLAGERAKDRVLVPTKREIAEW